MPKLPTYLLERRFTAPTDLMWKAWTEPSIFARWFGPNVETIVHHLDLKPGGYCLVEMRWSGGGSFQKLAYLKVTPPTRLVWLHSNTDDQGAPVSNPRMPDWPRTLLTTVTFTEDGEETMQALTWTPHEASDVEIACFAGAMDSMGKGWDAGMVILAQVLEELQS